ncbi:MAG: choice-of-anchor D domain-containing protein, partial [Candidatus Acidiferrales bacterium]
MQRIVKYTTILLTLALVVMGGMKFSQSRHSNPKPAVASSHSPISMSAQQPHAVSVAPLRALNFEPNVGQTDPQVKFLSRGKGYSLFLTRDGAVLSLRKPTKGKSHSQLNAGDPPLSAKRESQIPAVLRMNLIGADLAPQIAGLNPLPGKNNYFIGNDPSKWHSNVSTYSRVGYNNIYPGIDLVYYGNRGELEHDFIVKPGANPNSITLGFEGAEQLKLDAKGDLLVRTGGDEVSFHAPMIYQQSNGKKHAIAGRYIVKNERQVGFEVAAYNTQEPLIIDPVLVYATYIGGSGDDFGTGIAVDSAGNAYVVGQTVSANFPTSATAFQKVLKSTVDNVFVSKVNTNGTALVYSTYIGGTGTDEGIGIAVDTAGSAYITGDTSSTDFPITATAFQKTIGDTAAGDAFVTKLSADGSSLTYSSYLGGDSFDIGFDIAVDSTGNAYVAGQTYSGNFPLAGTPAQSVFGGKSEAFITKVNPGGTAKVYSTYWGGANGDEQARAIVVDTAGNAYIAGQTTSTNFPTTASPIQATYGGGAYDSIVCKLNSTGSAMLYSTYVGGNDLDQGRGIAIDSAGNAYVTGQTASTNFPIAGNAFQKTYGGGVADGFVYKVNPTGSALVFSGYFGGNAEDQGDHGMAVDSSGNIYIAGFTKSPNFPITADAIQSTFQGGAYDAIIMKLTTDGSSQIYSTYYGGEFDDSGRAIAVDSQGNAYAVLYTNSLHIPTSPGAFQTVSGGGYDAFVVKISQSSAVASLSASSLTFPSQVVGTTSAAQAVTLTNTGNVAMTISGITVTGTNSTDFAQTNTCGSGLGIGANCSISVTFKPTAAGTRTASISLADNASGSPQTITLTGTAQSAGAVATLSTTSISFGNQLLNTNSASRTVLLTNTGAGTLTITGITFTGTNSTNYSQTNTCNGSVAGNASCTISVVFRPNATGTRTATMNIADNSVPSPQTVTLTGVGSTTAAAVASLSPSSLTYTNQFVNSTSAAQVITLTNTGNESLGVTSVTVTGANITDFAQTNTCAATILAAGSCTISVTFTPTVPGARSAAITLADNAANSPQSIPVSGTGVASPTGPFNHVFIVVESGQNYASVVGAVDMPYINGLIGQYGLATTYYADAHPGISDYFMLTTGQTVTTNNALPNTNVDNIVRELVATGKTWKVYAEDLPSVGYLGGDVNLYLQHHNPFVYFTDVQNSTVQQQNVVPFTQFATDLANNALPQYVFIVPNDSNDSEVGSRGGSDTWLQTNIDPLIKSAFFQNKGLLVITYDQSSTDNTNGGGQVATVIVAPNAKPGFKSTTLYEHASVLRLMASGLGVPVLPGAAATAADMGEFFVAAPAVGLAPLNLTFASQTNNTTSAAQSITLTNTGNAPLVIASIAASAQYAQTNTCPVSPASLAAAGTCSISVTFTPTASGPQPGTITINDNVNGSPQTVPLTGTGVAPAPVVTLAPTSLTFPNQALNTTSAQQSVTLTNSGTAALTFTSITASAQYAQTNTCPVSPATLAAAGTCSISVTFTPTAGGTQTGSITIAD